MTRTLAIVAAVVAGWVAFEWSRAAQLGGGAQAQSVALAAAVALLLCLVKAWRG